MVSRERERDMAVDFRFLVFIADYEVFIRILLTHTQREREDLNLPYSVVVVVVVVSFHTGRRCHCHRRLILLTHIIFCHWNENVATLCQYTYGLFPYFTQYIHTHT